MKPKAALAGSVLVFVVNVIMTALVLPSDVPVFFMPGSQPDVYVPRALYLIGTLAGVLVAAIAVSRTAAVLLKFYLYGTKSQSIGSEARSDEHTSELQSLMRISYAVFCLKKKHT